MFGNPVLGPRIVPFGQPRLQTDELPNGHPAFRVTQRFGDWDALFRNRIHGAIDIGNFYEGDAVLAMEDGFVIPLADPNGALGQEVQHDNGYRTQVWHLSRRVELMGTYVQRGRTIGYVGRTGLTISGAHVHVACFNAKGEQVDPWPLLDQNKAVGSGVVKFNDGVDGVNLRTSPDARQRNVYAVAYRDPKGIIRLSDNKRLGNTGSQRKLYATVKGSDGMQYFKLGIAGSGSYQYVQSRFMHRIA